MGQHKGVMFAGYESRLQPGGPDALAEEAFQGRDAVIYLRDLSGELYAMVHTDLPAVPFRNWDAKQATKVRHRKSGRVYTVENVEAMTRLIRLREDVNPNTGEPYRTRWYNVDDFDVMGLPTNPAAARAEIAAMQARMVELHEIMAQQERNATYGQPAAPPEETPEQRKARLYAELEALEAAEAPVPPAAESPITEETIAPKRKGKS